MQKHTKIYLKYFDENGLCEVCSNNIVTDIHHINARSSFGKKMKHLQDIIENLIGLCRKCHQKAHFQIKPYLRKDELSEIHLNNCKTV